MMNLYGFILDTNIQPNPIKAKKKSNSNLFS
jgi:hypothetical protein